MPDIAQLELFGGKERSPEWCAYFAGILDGEGWIGMHRASPIVQVQMCDEAIPHELSSVYGYKVRTWADKRNPQYSDVYCWLVQGAAVIRPLTDALPYLRLKNRQAHIALDIAAGVIAIAPGRSWRLPVSEQIRRDRAKVELAQLNRKGRRL